jgi:hypothetical protein
MKKQFLYILVLFAFVSCQDDVKFNSPSFQGQKDNVLWRAIDSKVILAANGSLSIEGYTRNETLTLITNSKNPGTYILGINNLNTATYVLEDSNPKITFKTEAGIDGVDGEIVIEKYDELNKTVTGKFKFNAVNVTNNPLVGPFLNFQYGRFYKVPVK